MAIKRQGKLPYGEGTFGAWLEEMLYASDMLVKDVAKGIGVKPMAVSNHLHLRTRPTFPMVVAYCWFFGNVANPLQVWTFVERDWG